LGVKPVAIGLTEKVREYAQLVPRRRYKVYSEEAQKRSQAGRAPQAKPQAQAPPAAKPQPAGAPAGGGPPGRIMGFTSTSVNYFIDGKRSILDIYEAVRAECGNLQVGSQDGKYAYVLGPEYPDVDLEAVANLIRAQEKNGVLEIIKAGPKRK